MMVPTLHAVPYYPSQQYHLAPLVPRTTGASRVAGADLQSFTRTTLTVSGAMAALPMPMPVGIPALFALPNISATPVPLSDSTPASAGPVTRSRGFMGVLSEAGRLVPPAVTHTEAETETQQPDSTLPSSVSAFPSFGLVSGSALPSTPRFRLSKTKMTHNNDSPTTTTATESEMPTTTTASDTTTDTAPAVSSVSDTNPTTIANAAASTTTIDVGDVPATTANITPVMLGMFTAASPAAPVISDVPAASDTVFDAPEIRIVTMAEYKKWEKEDKKNTGCNKCPFCEKLFGVQTNLRAHVLIHTGHKPHQCDICDKTFNHPTNLRLHMATHMKEPPFACKHCPKRLTTNGNLQRHMKTKHPEAAQIENKQALVKNCTVGPTAKDKEKHTQKPISKNPIPKHSPKPSSRKSKTSDHKERAESELVTPKQNPSRVAKRQREPTPLAPDSPYPSETPLEALILDQRLPKRCRTQSYTTDDEPELEAKYNGTPNNYYEIEVAHGQEEPITAVPLSSLDLTTQHLQSPCAELQSPNQRTLTENPNNIISSEIQHPNQHQTQTQLPIQSETTFFQLPPLSDIIASMTIYEAHVAKKVSLPPPTVKRDREKPRKPSTHTLFSMLDRNGPLRLKDILGDIRPCGMPPLVNLETATGTDDAISPLRLKEFLRLPAIRTHLNSLGDTNHNEELGAEIPKYLSPFMKTWTYHSPWSQPSSEPSPQPPSPLEDSSIEEPLYPTMSTVNNSLSLSPPSPPTPQFRGEIK